MLRPEVEHLSFLGRQAGVTQSRNTIPIGRDGCPNGNASQRAEVEIPLHDGGVAFEELQFYGGMRVVPAIAELPQKTAVECAIQLPRAFRIPPPQIVIDHIADEIVRRQPPRPDVHVTLLAQPVEQDRRLERIDDIR